MEYNIGYVRSQGLQAKWSRTSRGTPIIIAKAEDGDWYAIDAGIWRDAAHMGLKTSFENHTALGKFFSISI